MKVLLFLDVGGSMDATSRRPRSCSPRPRAEFRQLEHFYFHNCLYEGVWKNNRRRHGERVPTLDLHKSDATTTVIFVGDASMSPYEI